MPRGVNNFKLEIIEAECLSSLKRHLVTDGCEECPESLENRGDGCIKRCFGNSAFEKERAVYLKLPLELSFSAPVELAGRLVKVKIVRAYRNSMLGELID